MWWDGVFVVVVLFVWFGVLFGNFLCLMGLLFGCVVFKSCIMCCFFVLGFLLVE